MNTIDLRLPAKAPVHFQGPSEWNEVTPRQWLQWVRWQTDLEGAMAGRFLLLQLWFGLKFRTLRLLDEAQQLRLLELLDWTDRHPSRWMLPVIWIRGRRWVGPGDQLEHLTFGEFVFAEAARTRYQAAPSREDLEELAAILYRPARWPWQHPGEGGRSRFDRHQLEGHRGRMAALPAAILKGTLINYLGALEQLPRAFPHLYKGSGSSDQTSGSWLDVGLQMARQTTAFGSYHQLENTNLYLVLTTLDAMLKENEDLERKLKER
ncbi:hypothetical protein [Larkinella soli]|uniref:hypothetical protein n=1 Tax=Larkinella soli TaxID=1770527 RepID=UPI000FFB4F62|nr:hypothetical protein [Larkinella soli]